MYSIDNNTNNFKTTNFQSERNIMDNAPSYIKAIIKKLESAKNRKEMYEILDDAVNKTSDFVCVDDTCFVGNGYRFQCTLKQYTDKYNIPQINRESGFKILKIIPIGDSDRSVVVLKANG